MKKHPKRQLRAVQTSRHLQVVMNHQHTGHVLHRRHTSYPTLAMILLCVGVLLASWTRMVTADSFTVTHSGSYTVGVRVPGPPPSDPATIVVPAMHARFTAQPITLSGTCPNNTYTVAYRNGSFSGVALCQPDNTYEIQTSLFPGVNQLQVQDFSLTDVPGPLSDPISVTYDPPVPPTPPASSGESTSSGSGGNTPSTTNHSGPQVSGEPLIFKTNFAYAGHYVGSTTTWQLDIEGGTAPYAIAVDWGDGKQSVVSRPTAGTFTLEHVYDQAGGYRGSYVTKFRASDADGQETFLQLMAIVNNPPNAAGTTKNSDNKPNIFNSTTDRVLRFIWPGYILVVLMLLSFWLGERREYHHLKPMLKKSRHA